MSRVKKKTPKELERNKDYQKDYYAENRDEILRKRREKYEKDPEYRERMRARDQRNYWFGGGRKTAEEKTLPDVRFEDVAPKGHINIVVENPKDARHGQNIQVAVYGTPEVGELLARDPQTIRKWLKGGVIPEPAFRGEDLPEGSALKRGRSQRLYTEDEVRAIYDARDLLLRPFQKMSESLFSQQVREALEEMEQGLVLVPKEPAKKKEGEVKARLTGKCTACSKPFVGAGDPTATHRCRSCGFPVQLEG